MTRRLIPLLCLLSLPGFAAINQLIIFGDSLSDTGNFPESPSMLWNANKPPTLVNYVPQWYVPLSNPIDTSSNSVKPGQWPILNEVYLEQQPPIMGSPRQYRSMGWVQFLLSMENSHITLVASQLLHTKTLPSTFSFN